MRAAPWGTRGLLLCAWFAFASGRDLPAQDDAAKADASDPAAVARAIIAADNAGDLERVLELYATDAELWPPGEPRVRGKRLIERRYRRIFASTRLDLATRITRVRVGDGWALVEGDTYGTASPLSGREGRRVNDKYLMVLEQRGPETWKITLLMWSSN